MYGQVYGSPLRVFAVWLGVTWTIQAVAADCTSALGVAENGRAKLILENISMKNDSEVIDFDSCRSEHEFELC